MTSHLLIVLIALILARHITILLSSPLYFLKFFDLLGNHLNTFGERNNLLLKLQFALSSVVKYAWRVLT